jgi:small conductance mechanosensitive channel
MNNNQFNRRDVTFDKVNYNQSMEYTKRSFLKKIIILGAILALTLSITTFLLKPLVPNDYLIYTQIAQIAIMGCFVIEIVGNTAFKIALAAQRSGQTAKSIRSLMRIVGSVALAAIAASYLSQNPILAASIATISAIVVGFAAQNLIGNMIAGMYLAIIRPFKIGDKITVFGNTGRVYEIGLLLCELLMENGDTVRVPSSSLLTTSIILREGKESNLPSSYIC